MQKEYFEVLKRSGAHLCRKNILKSFRKYPYHDHMGLESTYHDHMGLESTYHDHMELCMLLESRKVGI